MYDMVEFVLYNAKLNSYYTENDPRLVSCDFLSSGLINKAKIFSNKNNVIEHFERVLINKFFRHGSKNYKSSLMLSEISMFLAEAREFKLVHTTNIKNKGKEHNYVYFNLYQELAKIVNYHLVINTYNQDLAVFYNWMNEKNKMKKFILMLKTNMLYFTIADTENLKAVLGGDTIHQWDIKELKHQFSNSYRSNKKPATYYIATDNITDVNVIKLCLDFNDITLIETKTFKWFI